MLNRYRPLIVGIALVVGCVFLVLPVPHYVSGFRPAKESFHQKDAVLDAIAKERHEAYIRLQPFTAERENALREGKQIEDPEFLAREREAKRLMDEAQARMDAFKQSSKNDELLMARSAIETAYVKAVWLVAISGLGMLLSWTVGLTVWRRGGIRAGIFSGVIVGLFVVSSIENVWWSLIVRWWKMPHYFLTPLAAGIVGLAYGLLCGLLTRSMRHRTINAFSKSA